MEVYGTLIDWFETGSEGIHWGINKRPSGAAKGARYDDLFFLEEGDHLEIYCPDTLYTQLQRKTIWEGTLEKDREILMTQSSTNPEYEQQNVCGRWVQWLQKDFEDHEQWYWFFLLSYPAKLVRRRD